MKWQFIRGVDTLSYLPPVLQEYEEIGVLAQVEEDMLIEALNDINMLYQSISIETADANTLSILERQWQIPSQKDATLEDRRVAVIARMASFAALYTKRTLYNALETVCGKDGFTLEITYERFYVRVLIELKSKNQVDSVRSLLRQILPANMIYDVEIRYNQHETLHRLPHREMAAFTHNELRNSLDVRELSLSKG